MIGCPFQPLGLDDSSHAVSLTVASLAGWSSLVVMMGMALGPLYAEYMADRSGSYVSVFATLVICALFGGIFFLLAKNLRSSRQRSRFDYSSDKRPIRSVLPDLPVEA